MASCVNVVGSVDIGGSQVAVIGPYQGQSGGGCPGMVVFSPDEADQVLALIQEESSSTNELPPSADLAAAWSAGFFLVVSSYVIGWAVGAVVNFINGK
ncbi:MAG: hypothetical protein QM788_17490 [Roseateles sp.]|uniref:hypothetical protein n=1 Tax=Roseateles sp. TaxID=1971397 RepID=UPI0039E8A6E5